LVELSQTNSRKY